jgi:hypothetical protein
MSINSSNEYSYIVKKRTTGIILFTLVCLNLLVPHQQARAEVCPTYDAQKVFDGGSFYDAIWNSPTITWTFEKNELANIGPVWGETSARVSRIPSSTERTIIEKAFENWDRALDSRTITFTTSPNADIKVGFVESQGHPWFFRYYTKSQVPPRGNLFNGVIGFSSLETAIINEGYFSALAHRRVANILGMGLILNANSNPTVMKGDPQDVYDAHSGSSLKNEGARYVPTDYEIGLIRSLYGESTCASDFGKKFDEERNKEAKKQEELEKARKAFEDARVRADAEVAASKAAAELKAKEEAEAKAATELRAKQEAEASAELKAEQEAAAKAAALKKTTIVCVKGKLTKKVTAVKPKCPTGYKLKK